MTAGDFGAVTLAGSATWRQRPNVAARHWQARSEYVPVARTGSRPVTARPGASNVQTLLVDSLQGAARTRRSRFHTMSSQSTRVGCSYVIASDPTHSLPRQGHGLLMRFVRGAADAWSPAREACEDRLEARRRERASKDAFTACPRRPAVAGDRSAAPSWIKVRRQSGRQWARKR